ncbi:SRPBCC family protein [Streptomyces clavuligerus]|uniref:Putative cyclase n=1 Tax=Streptomyces clavuligerus TaxID=1901 RepID=E2PV95_STRCL|nr:SRPBCC family protein [Streptomyces clavuligerus]ANW21074.1 polyketide cyclase [Streptomyces clavuligerus]AXU15693.1 polyketide cyclase [Streptomyces clavuligerus]EFG05842.1 putative cyclase [Streptomyces clavuligerus]MBY6305813.1 SRPBCC family protein [Streptomyces clavuligerus]QCS08472.1 polyketide cyclase [Streptomyces clavuligerus]
MDWSRFRFHSVWDLPGPPDAVFAVLERAADYPRWWPGMREVVPLDGDRAAARVRAVLPYEIRIVARPLRRDPGAGVLLLGMDGDLAGWARWTVTGHGAGTRAVFDQEVEVMRPLLRRLAPFARPAFSANHALLMRSGRRALTARLRAAGR